MTSEDLILIFERLNMEGRVAVDVDQACAGFAEWLAFAWDRLDNADVALLTSVGATLWSEGLEKESKLKMILH